MFLVEVKFKREQQMLLNYIISSTNVISAYSLGGLTQVKIRYYFTSNKKMLNLCYMSFLKYLFQKQPKIILKKNPQKLIYPVCAEICLSKREVFNFLVKVFLPYQSQGELKKVGFVSVNKVQLTIKNFLAMKQFENFFILYKNEGLTFSDNLFIDILVRAKKIRGLSTFNYLKFLLSA